jgi:hypothetical protein
MIKLELDHYAVTNNGWFAKSSDLIADFLMSLLILGASFQVLIFDFRMFFPSFLCIIIPSILILIYSKKSSHYIYPISLFMNSLFVIFIIPLQMIHPVSLFISTLSAGLINLYLLKKFKINFHISVISLLIVFIISQILFYFQISNPVNSTLKNKYLSDSVLNAYSMAFFPSYFKNELDFLRFSIFELFGVFSLMLVSLGNLRSPKLIFVYLFNLATLFFFYSQVFAINMNGIIIWSVIWFLLINLPGRNPSSSTLVTLTSSLILFVFSFLTKSFLSKYLPPFALIVLFFSIESSLMYLIMNNQKIADRIRF